MLHSTTKSAAIRARLSYPVIDSDGHTLEHEPTFLDYLKDVGGARVHGWYTDHRRQGHTLTRGGFSKWHQLSWEERKRTVDIRPGFWGAPTKNTLDRATATLPKLLYERMNEMGFDFTVIYPTLGLMFPHIDEDEELRRACCRAINAFHADMYRQYADRMTPVAMIPMHTPQEAIEELEYSVRVLGFKVVGMAGYVRRPIPAAAAHSRADYSTPHACRLDCFGLDSDYDYDPLWAKCEELKVAPTFHSGGREWGHRTSVSNTLYNRIGHFADGQEAVAKSLFLGGVTSRFPNLKCAFLECGVSWACRLYADLLVHWEKRNINALENYNPANLDRELWASLCDHYGDEKVRSKVASAGAESDTAGFMRTSEDPELLDEWKACRITTAEDVRDLFINRYYFGCEADDPLNVWAFNNKVNPLGARLKALFSSDIGHWDVPDMTMLIEEAHEAVEKGLITDQDFKDFVFTNPADFYTGVNPDFFKGTAVENSVATLVTHDRR